MDEQRQTGFWVEVGRPIFSWIFACAAVTFLLAAAVTNGMFEFNFEEISELEEWFSLPDLETMFPHLWAIAFTVGLLLSAVPTLMAVLLQRALRLKRGWSDTFIAGSLPYAACVSVFMPYATECVDQSQELWAYFLPLIPICAFGGFLYWLANGCPKAR